MFVVGGRANEPSQQQQSLDTRPRMRSTVFPVTCPLGTLRSKASESFKRTAALERFGLTELGMANHHINYISFVSRSGAWVPMILPARPNSADMGP